MIKRNLLVCASGGRTSMYMLEWLLVNKKDTHNIVGIFANTGWEHPETLEFVHKCEVRWKGKYGFELVWLEADVHKGRKSSTHKVVNYHTASRKREPFIEVVKKYGLPNKGYPHCTRELKENPIHSYVKNVLGWSNTLEGNSYKEVLDTSMGCSYNIYYSPYQTAIGIRIDEPKRLKYNKTHQNKVYPLVDWHPEQPDKLDILDWWEEMSFNLHIPEHLGNCVACFRKSDKKLMKAYRDAPSDFEHNLEDEYGHIGTNLIEGVLSEKPRTMYRSYKKCGDIIQMFKESGSGYLRGEDIEENEGCASSCEPFVN